MSFKLLAALAAIALAVTFILPIVFKIREMALVLVIFFGIALMIADAHWDVREKND